MSLTAQQLQAAAFVAAGDKTTTEIAEAVGISRRTLGNWKASVAFQEEVERFAEQSRAAALRVSIADRQERLKRLDKRWNQIDSIFDQRAADRAHIGVPGHDTGLLCHEQKSVGGGELATIIDVYRADVALLKEERELGKQAAIELGQWQEKGEQSGDIKVTIVHDSPDPSEAAYGAAGDSF